MVKINIFHTNDIHSRYNQLAKISTYLKKHRKENDLTLDAGDFIDFSFPLNYATKGQCGIDLLNKCGYDALAIGNNEGFNKRKIVEKLAKKDKVKFLSVNLKKKNLEDLDYILPSIIIKKKNISFLIIGATPYVQSYNDYFNLYDFSSLPPYDLIRKEIKKYQGKYDFTILLSHLGLRYDTLIAQSDLNIDLIIGGHSHTLLPLKKINNTFIHQVGVYGTHLGVIKLFFDKEKKYKIKAEEISVKNYVKDIEVLQEIEKQEKKAFKNLQKKLFNVPDKLFTSKNKENSFSNFLADSMLRKYPSDFAIVNSGMLNQNLDEKELTLKKLLKINNSPIILTTIYIKGKYIIEALNLSLDKKFTIQDGHAPGFRGSFLGCLAVSNNVEVYYKKNNISAIFVNGKLLNIDKTYKVITTDYLKRGSYYTSLSCCEKAIYHKESVRDILCKYLKYDELYFLAKIKRWRKVKDEKL